MKNSSNKYRHASLILLLFPVISGFSFKRDISWPFIQTKITNTFPQVSHISTDSLKNILDKEKFFLIDVRDQEEFIISRIPGAIHIPTPEKVTYSKNSYIIVYCSIGYRSADFAEKLQNSGFTKVYNLRGSLFEWADKGYPLINDSGATTYVHPFNKKWGVLLNTKRHKYSWSTIAPQ